MADLSCGRESVCGHCDEIDPRSREDVCIAVGSVAAMSWSVDYTYEEMHGLAYGSMFARHFDDKGFHITSEMEVAATESAYDLIVNKK
jgi:hypothetical protein